MGLYDWLLGGGFGIIAGAFGWFWGKFDGMRIQVQDLTNRLKTAEEKIADLKEVPVAIQRLSTTIELGFKGFQENMESLEKQVARMVGP